MEKLTFEEVKNVIEAYGFRVTQTTKYIAVKETGRLNIATIDNELTTITFKDGSIYPLNAKDNLISLFTPSGLPASQNLSTDKECTGKGIRVGIVDTGILDNSQLNIVTGHNFTLDLTGRNNIFSNLYHGTMVASIIANIAPDVEFVIAKMLDEKGVGDPKKAAKAIKYCISQGCDIINCSITGAADKDLEKAIEEAYSKNIMVVAATGNDGKEKLLYPASYYHCISVGSINNSYELSPFSNYNALMDLVAIGEDVTICGVTDSGTSFSAPVVTGFLALLKAKLENPTWEELYKELINNCIKIDGLEKIKQGNGFINIKEANNK